MILNKQINYVIDQLLKNFY